MRGEYRKHNPELKRIVFETGNIELAVSRGVPRTTAIYWAQKMKRPERSSGKSEELLSDEIEFLKQKLIVERAKVQFLSKLAPHLEMMKSGKRKTSKRVKKLFVNLIEEFRKYYSVKGLLELVGEGKLAKWRSDLRRCENTKKYECGVRKGNQLTGDEVLKIVEIVNSKKYFHFSLTSLKVIVTFNNFIRISISFQSFFE